MSAAAIRPGADPLAGVTGALASFRTQLVAAGTSLRAALRAVDRATAAALGIRSGASAAAPAARRLTTGADAAGTSLSGTGRTAGVTATRLRAGGGKVRPVAASLGSVSAGTAAFGGVAGTLGKGAGTVSKLMGFFGGALTVGAGAMMAVNVAMRANPFGFVLGLIMPLAGFLIEYALSSQTGQKIMKQVFDQVLKAFRTIGTFLGPVLKAYLAVISAQFRAVRTIITAVVGGVGAALSRGFNGTRTAVTSATRAVTGLISRTWNGFRRAIQPTLDWITKRIPAMFTRVRNATSSALGAIGGFLSTGMQGVMAAVTGPVKALIAFANWVIDGLNRLSFSILGKKFGVDLPKIPQLAEGGVVEPGGGPSAVRPLSALDRLRPAEEAPTAGLRSGPPAPGRARLHTYHAAGRGGPLAIASDLLFLRGAAA
ncbi:tape-measure protein [Streptomyces sp. NPDC017546]|uniref:tape-measure protein n=1 Tax=Streptomyces sp. NPDC017546 TaxID=3365001 RepID=UPI0037ADF8DC